MSAVIRGSERSPVSGAVEVGSINEKENVELSLVVRSNPDSLLANVIELATGKTFRKYLSAEDFSKLWAPRPEDVRIIRDFATKNGLGCDTTSPSRVVKLSGEIGQLCKLFKVRLKEYRHPGGATFRGRSGPLYAPAALTKTVQAVFGFDDRQQAKTHFRRLLPSQTADSSYTPPQLAELYDFPQLDGTGQSIGLIELGGGYNQSDIDTYFTDLGLNTPNIVSVSVDNSSNAPTGDPNGPDGEVALDIEVAGGMAPAAKIIVYFAPNTDKGFLDAINAAVHDSENKPSVVSISWGGAESTWTSQAMNSFNQAFQEASTLGITICVASGDSGSSDGETDGLAHVDFPASAPYALGCGGTRLNSSALTIKGEVVWNDQSIGGGATGGGVSDIFSVPSWQANVGVPPSANPGGRVGRGVPDVSGDADPATGYIVQVDGQKTVFGGTSAVAPLWASLIVLLNQRIGTPVGYVNSTFYEELIQELPTGVKEEGFDDITQGNNGAYKAGPGWDPCTGLGSPNGSKLLAALTQE